MTVPRMVAVGLTVTAIGLSACSGTVGAPSGTSTVAPTSAITATPSPSTNQTYGSVTALRDAAVAAEYPCPKWTQDNAVTNAAQSGTCSDADVFSIYDNDTKLQAQIKAYKAFVGASSDSSSPTLVGPNWMINMPTQYFNQLRTKLGGEDLQVLPDPSPSPGTSVDSTFTGKAADFKVTIKIKKKQCFGSAGCNVTYQITPSYVGTEPLPTKGVIEVTYEVTGDESGPSTNTFTVNGEGTAHYDKEETASTPSSRTKLTGKVTDVSYDPDAIE